MNCYFCQTYLSDIKNGHSVWCDNCATTNDIASIVTTYQDNKIYYCHMYVKYTGKPIEDTTGVLSYHIRLQFAANNTYIGLSDEESYSEHIVTIPGLFLNPTNIKNKLKTILLFS